VEKVRGLGGQKIPIIVYGQGGNVLLEVARWSTKGKIMSTINNYTL
jgi:hypothetical protein